MAITSYECDGTTLWKVYVNVRSKKDPTLRLQKVIPRIKTKEQAIKLEKKWLQDLSRKVAVRENEGVSWETVILRWEEAAKKGLLGTYGSATIMDHVSCLLRLTKPWLNKSAGSITKTDARVLFRKLKEQDRSNSGLRKIKNTINVVFRYGMEEGLILGVQQSPVYGLKLAKTSEKSPDILSAKEVRFFLKSAKKYEHPWYSIWAFACLTGMRNGELYALRWEHLKINWESEESHGDYIRVIDSFNKRTNEIKSTKSGYWRTVPISKELKKLLRELKVKTFETEYVLPRIRAWKKGSQAEVLKGFLRGMGLKPVKFHALRACFATSLLGSGTPSAIVMKICGWKDFKTMDYYIRLAGVDEQGATECLNFLPDEEELMEEISRKLG